MAIADIRNSCFINSSISSLVLSIDIIGTSGNIVQSNFTVPTILSVNSVIFFFNITIIGMSFLFHYFNQFTTLRLTYQVLRTCLWIDLNRVIIIIITFLNIIASDLSLSKELMVIQLFRNSFQLYTNFIHNLLVDLRFQLFIEIVFIHKQWVRMFTFDG